MRKQMRYRESEESVSRLKLWEALDDAKGTIGNMKEVIEDLRKQLREANRWHKADMKAIRDKNLGLELAKARRVTRIDTLTRRNEWQARRIEELELLPYAPKIPNKPGKGECQQNTVTVTFTAP